MIYGNLILNGMSPLNEETLHSDVRKNHEVVDIQTLMDELINTITGLHMVLDLGRHIVEDVLKTWVELIKVSYRLKNNNQNNFISSTVMCDEKIDEPSSELEYLANRLLYIKKLFIQLQEDYQQQLLSNIKNDKPAPVKQPVLIHSLINTIWMYEDSEQKIPYENSAFVHRDYMDVFLGRIAYYLLVSLPCYNSQKTISSFNGELPDYKNFFLKIRAVFAYHSLELLEYCHSLHQHKDLQIVLRLGSCQLIEKIYQQIIESSYMPEYRYYNRIVFLERAQKISESFFDLLPDILQTPFTVRKDLVGTIRGYSAHNQRLISILGYEKTFLYYILEQLSRYEEALCIRPHHSNFVANLLRYQMTTDNMIFFLSIIKAIKSRLSIVDDDGNQRMTEYYEPIYESLGLCSHLVYGINDLNRKFHSFAQKPFTTQEICATKELSNLSFEDTLDTDSVEFRSEYANIEHYIHPAVETVQLPTYTYNLDLHDIISIPIIANRVWEHYENLPPQTQELSKEIYTKYLDFYVLMSASIKAIHVERENLQALLGALPAEYTLTPMIAQFMQNYNEELCEFTIKHKERLGDPQPKTITKNITITQPNNKT